MRIFNRGRPREIVLPEQVDRARAAVQRRSVRVRVADAQEHVREFYPSAEVCHDGIYWVAEVPGAARAVFSDGEVLAVWLDGFAAGAAAPREGENRE